MPIRLARYSDTPTIGSIFAAGFYDEEVVGVILHPYRDQFPQDFVAHWYHRCRERFWDHSMVYLVSYETDPASGKEVLTGAAEWKRQGLGWEKVWGLWGWWDPRRLIRPVFAFMNFLANTFFPNRAAAKPPNMTPTTFAPTTIPFVAHILSSPPYRNNCWALSCLAVLPQYQNRGYGRELAAWGVAKAKKEGIVASVVASKGKERFYQRCGFSELVGWLTDGEENPLKKLGVQGGAILFTPPSPGLEEK
ncbi:uncharacterized protein CIMG_01067 [Coccidioides immitis RS]|uniref:N-acetyltransferase domain-containing protein n=4 Tax=Coccidioides immitis TaxID=5501 RepID=J3KIC7_COCIM|nr:uncharacterized protein CIMG_01067 [Coccidioides immitis RS]KMP01006.1 hypothetical protein CIRG_01146 [Coccidioides immitis RMSCC 2394]KMU72768.1 hypothetical protein CISG_03202 [Coccidioides immitis RMSCC 3703]KMU83503.1 hypothetical protein CIHG_01285 [Coccidioides immitis H538.4]TPX26064.1 hypothetical protein DIZ76_011523 [Coccidioides immitis]EAS35713.3 hypothetical protein CIMG_01067 [Coccidioides immitis RS]